MSTRRQSYRRKNDKKSKLYLIIGTVIALVVLLGKLGVIDLDESASTPTQTYTEGSATVHFLDVGQGDCGLIVADNGMTMLIDASEREYGARVVSYLHSNGITKLDYIVASHPHSDHIGGLVDVINSEIEVGTVIIPSVPEEHTPTTRVYEDFLYAIAYKGCNLAFAKSETIQFGEGEITIIPTNYTDDNYNNYSSFVRYEYQGCSFIFSGDAEKSVEKELVSKGVIPETTVLKAPHHGSSTSSSYEYLGAVSPEYIVISCGTGNSYGHPHDEIVKRYEAYTENIYRTDTMGNIIFTVENGNMTVSTEK